MKNEIRGPRSEVRNRAFRFQVSALILLLVAAAPAQDTLYREISRTNNVNLTQARDAISWYQGETIRYDLAIRRGSVAWNLPTNTIPVWSVTDASLTNFMLHTTGTVVTATNGLIRFEADAATTALTNGTDYQSIVVLYQQAGGTNRYIGVADRTSAKVLQNANYTGSLVPPISDAAGLAILQALILATGTNATAAQATANAAHTNAAAAQVTANSAMTNAASAQATADAAHTNAAVAVALGNNATNRIQAMEGRTNDWNTVTSMAPTSHTHTLQVVLAAGSTSSIPIVERRTDYTYDSTNTLIWSGGASQTWDEGVYGGYGSGSPPNTTDQGAAGTYMAGAQLFTWYASWMSGEYLGIVVEDGGVFSPWPPVGGTPAAGTLGGQLSVATNSITTLFTVVAPGSVTSETFVATGNGFVGLGTGLSGTAVGLTAGQATLAQSVVAVPLANVTNAGTAAGYNVGTNAGTIATIMETPVLETDQVFPVWGGPGWGFQTPTDYRDSLGIQSAGLQPTNAFVPAFTGGTGDRYWPERIQLYFRIAQTTANGGTSSLGTAISTEAFPIGMYTQIKRISAWIGYVTNAQWAATQGALTNIGVRIYQGWEGAGAGGAFGPIIPLTNAGVVVNGATARHGFAPTNYTAALAEPIVSVSSGVWIPNFQILNISAAAPVTNCGGAYIVELGR